MSVHTKEKPKLTDDEPVFILRGSDALTPVLLRYWAEMYLQSNKRKCKAHDEPLPPEVKRKHDQVLRLAEDMEEWNHKHQPT
jgi:hypothetical protein